MEIGWNIETLVIVLVAWFVIGAVLLHTELLDNHEKRIKTLEG